MGIQIKNLTRPRKKLEWLHYGSVGLMVFSLCLPVLEQVSIQHSYSLDDKSFKLVGAVNDNLSKKLSYDSSRDIWQFNKDGSAAQAKAQNVPAEVMAQLKSQQAAQASDKSSLKAQVGGSGAKDTSLYSVDLPTDPSKGITYYDNNSTLSFTMTPQFEARNGRDYQGRLIYPIKGGKLVYTAKNNGMKEDIILDKNIGDQLSFSYKLNLPDTLEAKLQSDGSLGVFSADPALYSDITYASDADHEKVDSARKTAAKDHLMFALPAPSIAQTGGGAGRTEVNFALNGNILSLQARNMSTLRYPATIDPSVVITSSSDFQTKGSDEGGIDYSTSGQITKGAHSGGLINAYTTSGNVMPGLRAYHSTLAYNGYLYVVGGTPTTVSNGQASVYYSALNSGNGSVGTWASTTTTYSTGRVYPGAVAYDGYMYVYGGYANGSSTLALDDVQYAPIDSNGDITTAWKTSTNSMSFASCRFGYTALNGYLYAIGGTFGTVASSCANTSTPTNKTQYAPINADGSVGAWQQTATLTNARMSLATLTYNGYIYAVTGTVTGTGGLTDVDYARPNDDGSITAWPQTTAVPTAAQRIGAAVYNGYMYYFGAGQNTRVAPINANGTIGKWSLTTTLNVARSNANIGAVYNGYLYAAGGDTGAALLDTAEYASIQSGGVVGPDASVTNYTTGRRSHGSVAYGGYLYIIGGFTTVAKNDTQRAPINADGTLGTWTAGTSLVTARYNFGLTINNGYIYAIGGMGTSAVLNTVEYATIDTAGTIGTWATTTTITNARQGNSAVAYGNYVYTLGGYDGASTNYSDVQSALINTNGTLNAWASTTGFSNARRWHSSVVNNGYVYVIGGYDGTTYYNNVQYAPLNANGTITAATWTTSGNTFSNARYGFGASTYNGYLYLSGGYDGTTFYADTQYVPLNANGSTGTWAQTTAFSTGRQFMAAVTYNGYLYQIGGVNSAASNQTSVRFQLIEAGGNGSLNTWTTNGTSLSTPYPSGWAYGRMVACNGYLYAIGGYNGTTTYTNVNYAPINQDGSVGAWASTNALNVGRYSEGVVVNNGYIYAIAGHGTGTTFLGDYEYAAINANGTLGTWTRVTTGALTTARSDFAYAAYNNYVYVYGGAGSAADQNDVNYAVFNSNGTLGSWTNVANSFTGIRNGLRGFAYNGYLYVVGGVAGSTYFNDVQFIALNSSTGALSGSWAYTAAMPTTRAQHSLVVANGYVYVYGGTNASLQAPAIVAGISGSGQLNNWSHTTSLTTARNSSGYAIYNGVVYMAGGFVPASTYQTDMQYALVNASPKKATYSKLIDLGGSYSPASISFNGSLGAGLGDISYRLAGVNGIYGPFQQARTLSTAATPCVAGTVRYVWLRVLLDGGANGATAAGPGKGTGLFPDSTSTQANATDITLNYNTALRPAPGVRLHGGKSFLGQVQQALDTCGP